MADKKISQLPPLSAPTIADLLAIVNAAVTKKITLDDLFKSIGGGILLVTKSQLLGLRNTSSLVPGKFYLIIDADPNGFYQVIVMAASLTQLCIDGCLIAKVPDYQQTIASNLGIWNADLTPSSGNKAIWGGKMWNNLTGQVGFASDDFTLDAVNWELVPPNPGTLYAVEVDAIHYDATPGSALDWNIIKREDKRGNCVEGVISENEKPIEEFQWGRNQVTGNKVSFSMVRNINALLPQKNMEVSDFSNLRIPDNVDASGAEIRGSEITVQGDTVLVDSHITNSSISTQGNYDFTGTKADDSSLALSNTTEFVPNYRKMLIVSSTLQNQDLGNSTYERTSIYDSDVQVLTTGGVDFSLGTIEDSQVQVLHDNVFSFFSRMRIRGSSINAEISANAGSFTSDSSEISGSNVAISSFVGEDGADFSLMRIKNSNVQVEQNGSFIFTKALIEDSNVDISDGTVNLPAEPPINSDFTNFTALKNASVSILSFGDLFVSFRAIKSQFSFVTAGAADFTNAQLDDSNASFLGNAACVDLVVEQQSTMAANGNADFSQAYVSSQSSISSLGDSNFKRLIIEQDSSLNVSGNATFENTLIRCSSLNIQDNGIFECMTIVAGSQFIASGNGNATHTELNSSVMIVDGDAEVQHANIAGDSVLLISGNGIFNQLTLFGESVVIANGTVDFTDAEISGASVLIVDGEASVQRSVLKEAASVILTSSGSFNDLMISSSSQLVVTGNSVLDGTSVQQGSQLVITGALQMQNAEISQNSSVSLTSNGVFNRMSVSENSQVEVSEDADLSNCEISGASVLSVSGACTLSQTQISENSIVSINGTLQMVNAEVSQGSNVSLSSNGTLNRLNVSGGSDVSVNGDADLQDCEVSQQSELSVSGLAILTGLKVRQNSDVSVNGQAGLSNGEISKSSNVAISGDGSFDNIWVSESELSVSGSPNLRRSDIRQNAQVLISGDLQMEDGRIHSSEVFLLSEGSFNGITITGSDLNIFGDGDYSGIRITGSDVSCSGSPDLRNTEVKDGCDVSLSGDFQMQAASISQSSELSLNSGSGIFNMLSISGGSDVQLLGDLNTTNTTISEGSEVAVSSYSDGSINMQNAEISGSEVNVFSNGFFNYMKVSGQTQLDVSGDPDLTNVAFSQNSNIAIIGPANCKQLSVFGESNVEIAMSDGASVDVTYTEMGGNSSLQISATGIGNSAAFTKEHLFNGNVTIFVS